MDPRQILMIAKWLALAALVGLLAYSRYEIAGLEVDLGAAGAKLTAALDAFHGEQKTVTELRAANGEWAARAAASDQGQRDAVTESLKNKAALAAAMARRTSEESADAKLPDCQKLRAMDVAAMCPATAGWLFPAHRIQGPASPGGSAGPGPAGGG